KDVDRLLGRLAEFAQGNVLVTVRPESPALLTAAEFFRLFSAARKSGVSLTIRSDDPLRCELARMLGWAVDEPTERAAEDDSPTQVLPETRFSAGDLAEFVRQTPPDGNPPERSSEPEAPTSAIALPEDD